MYQRYILPPSSGHQQIFTRLHDTATQKTAIFILTAVRASYPTKMKNLQNCLLISALVLYFNTVRIEVASQVVKSAETF
jgi:hypothetical protein